jgi:hypothetical protein
MTLFFFPDPALPIALGLHTRQSHLHPNGGSSPSAASPLLLVTYSHYLPMFAAASPLFSSFPWSHSRPTCPPSPLLSPLGTYGSAYTYLCRHLLQPLSRPALVNRCNALASYLAIYLLGTPHKCSACPVSLKWPMSHEMLNMPCTLSTTQCTSYFACPIRPMALRAVQRLSNAFSPFAMHTRVSANRTMQ